MNGHFSTHSFLKAFVLPAVLTILCSTDLIAQITTVSSADTTICPGSSVQLFTTPSGGSSYTYTWSPATGLNNANIASPVATPSSSTIYTVMVINTPTSDTVTDVVVVTVQNVPPPVGIIPQKDTICGGDSVQLKITNTALCAVVPGTCLTTTATGTVGSGTFWGGSQFENPFFKVNNFFQQVRSNKRQFIFTKNDLTNVGVTGPTNLTSLFFNFNLFTGSQTYDNLRINIGCTNDSVFGNWQGGLSNVYIPKTTVISGSGWREFVFDNAFRWDGESNLVVELCYVNASASNGTPFIQYEIITGQNVMRYQVANSNVCGVNSGQNINRRPNTRFKFCDLVHTDTLTYTWTPPAGLSSAVIRSPKASPTSTTTYIATITDANGCSVVDTSEIVVGNSFAFTVNSDTALCEADTIPLISTDNAGPGASYQWSSGALITNDTLPNTTAYFTADAVVYLSIKSTAGCERTDSFSVSLNPPVNTAILTQDTTICAGDSLPIDISTSAVGCQAYNWISCTNQSDLTFSGTSSFPSGGVTISPYDANGFGNNPGQKKQYIILASELAALTNSKSITSLGFNLLSTGSASTLRQGFTIKIGCTSQSSFTGFGSIPFIQSTQTVYTPKNINISSGWNDYAFDAPYVWDGTSNLVVEVCWQNTSSLGFTFTTMNYTILAANRTAMKWNSPPFCSDTVANFGTTVRPEMRLKYCSSPPNQAYSYQWTPAAGLDNDTIPNVKASPSASTPYELRVTDPQTGCFDLDTIDITVAPNFNTTTTADSILCIEDSVQLNASHTSSNPVTYLWSPAALVSSTSVSNPYIFVNDAITILSEIKSSLGCIKWDTLNFGVQDALDINLSSAAGPNCEGDSLRLFANPLLGCGKSNSSLCNASSTMNIGTQTFTSSQFNITPFVSSDLSGRKQFLITAAEIASAGLNTSGQISSLSFDISNLGKDDYQNFRIKMGCTSSNSMSTTFTGGLATVFEPKDIILVNGINWFDFDNRFNWDGLSNVVVEVCYQNSALGISSEVRYSQPFPVFNCVSYNRGNSVCSNNSASLYNRRANIGFKYCSYVPNSFSYDWSPSNLFDNPTLKNPKALMDSPGRYYLDLTDLTTGCILTDSIDLSLISFDVDAQKDTTLCNTTDYPLSVTTNAADPKYFWYPGWEVSNDTIPNPSVTVKNGSFYSVMVIDTSGCIKSDTVFINLLPNPAAVVSASRNVCRDEIVQLQGSGGGTYNWTPAAALDDASIPNPVARVNETTTFVLGVTNSFGCTDEDSLTLTVYPSPLLDLGPDTNYCLGGFLKLKAGPDFASYAWQDNSSDSVLLVLGDGQYWVRVTDAFNCTFTDTVEIGLAPLPKTDIRFFTEICEGDSAILDASNAGSAYSWSTGETSQQIVVRTPGFYWVEINDGTCIGRDSTNLVVYEYPVSELPRTAVFCKKENPFGITLSAGGEDYRYKWDNGQVTPSITVSEEGTYGVTIINGRVCEVRSFSKVVEYCTEKIFVPNAFTPNNDQINDIFSISALNLDDFEFHIYNRWGELIYLTKNPNFTWDGTKDGKPVPSDTYVWKIFYKIKEADGKIASKEEKGSLNLIR